MRPLAGMLLVLTLAACTPAAAGIAAVPTPQGEEPAAETILVSEGGMLRPLENGGRVAISDGWATVRFSPPPLQRSDLVLDVAVLDAKGRPVQATVAVTYEMLQMDHGRSTERAVPHDGLFRMAVRIPMPGAWRFTIHIDRDGVASDLIVVVPEIG